MTVLNPKQLSQYENKGYVSPIDILIPEEAEKIKLEIEFIEKKWPNELIGIGRNNAHYISTVLDQVCHNSKILDAVESIIGKNILVCSTTLFIKNAYQKGFVSYHQDAKYIGLEPHNWVTAWIAITDSNEINGCMRMWPGSHKHLKEHNQKFNEGNLLTRGQTIENVPEDQIKLIELKAGQMSLHHPRIVHGSGVNKRDDGRIGFVIQSYIGTNVKQVLGKNGVQIARGVDEFKYHEVINRTKFLMSEEGMLLRKRENDNLKKIFYNGSNKIGKF